jgi:hypothetical protein
MTTCILPLTRIPTKDHYGKRLARRLTVCARWICFPTLPCCDRQQYRARRFRYAVDVCVALAPTPPSSRSSVPVQKQVVTRVAFAPGERIWVCVTRISSQIWDTGFATSFTGTQLRKTLSPLILSRHTRPKHLDTGRAVASDPSSTGGEVLAWGLELIAGA